MKQLPEIGVLRDRLSLNMDTGVLYWNSLPDDGKRQTRRWNKRYSGKEAGTIQERGYRSIRILNKAYLAHRIILFMATGIDPIGFDVDHIDGNTSNNSHLNLRMVSHSENIRNRKGPTSVSSTGVLRVFKTKNKAGFQAAFIKNGKSFWVGSFQDVNKAKTALDEAIKTQSA